MLVITALAVVRTHSLFAIVALSGVFSLLSALLFITLDAVDVAFTEAAVGAGISTSMIRALQRSGLLRDEANRMIGGLVDSATALAFASGNDEWRASRRRKVIREEE